MQNLQYYPLKRLIITQDNKRAHFTLTQWKILMVMLEAPGHYYSCKYLAEQLSYHATSRTEATSYITVYACRIRSKLQKIGVADVFEIKRGVGYRIANHVDEIKG